VTLRPRARTPKVARTKETRTAAKAVADALDLYHLSDEVRAGRLLTEWADLVGPKIAQRTRPDGIVDRTLWIEVVSAAWMHELNVLRPQIVKGLFERFGEPRLFDDLKFKLAGRYRREPVALRAKRPPPKPAKPLPPPATGAAREAIVREASAIDDQELRELIARLRITHDK
jgi:predicted nucleic acid-binding Zn ribbon protein